VADEDIEGIAERARRRERVVDDRAYEHAGKDDGPVRVAFSGNQSDRVRIVRWPFSDEMEARNAWC
jgi:hypothetical protein